MRVQFGQVLQISPGFRDNTISVEGTELGLKGRRYSFVSSQQLEQDPNDIISVRFIPEAGGDQVMVEVDPDGWQVVNYDEFSSNPDAETLAKDASKIADFARFAATRLENIIVMLATKIGQQFPGAELNSPNIDV